MTETLHYGEEVTRKDNIEINARRKENIYELHETLDCEAEVTWKYYIDYNTYRSNG